MFSDIFQRLLDFGGFFSLYSVDMATSKHTIADTEPLTPTRD